MGSRSSSGCSRFRAPCRSEEHTSELQSLPTRLSSDRKALGYDPETTLHDVRYGERFAVNGLEEFVWLFEISGAVPAAHLTGGYAGAVSERQPAMYFRLGGGSLKGVSKPGEIVWSRI